MTEPVARRRVRAVDIPEGKTHDEIYQLIEASSLKADQAVQASAEIKDLIKGLTLAIGTDSQDEYGQPVGTGIVGRLMRLERDVQRAGHTRDQQVGRPRLQRELTEQGQRGRGPPAAGEQALGGRGRDQMEGRERGQALHGAPGRHVLRQEGELQG
jgi:hypothetical protein